jgi:hypothetical protein
MLSARFHLPKPASAHLFHTSALNFNFNYGNAGLHMSQDSVGLSLGWKF